MKFIWLFLLLSLISLGTAENQKSGIGIIVGEPSGLSFKQFLSTHNAWDAALAWSGTRGRIQLHADYLMHRFNKIQVKKGQLPWYFGIGAFSQLGNSFRFGARIPVGMEYFFEQSPVALFMEIVPKLELIPDSSFDMDAAVGIRFYF